MEESQYWLKFFRAAGLSENEIKAYSVLFSKHRIHPNMLDDLSKEYLTDVGITAMGDVIAILKCAKTVIEGKQKRDALKKLQNSTPAGRTLSHHLDIPTDISSATATSVQSNVSNNSYRPVVLASASSVQHQSINGVNKNVTAITSVQSTKPAQPTKPTPAAKSTHITTVPVSEKVSTKGKTGPVIRDNVPVPVKRFVAPEHEGRYVIKLPKGTTPKTGYILKLLASKLKTMETTSKHKVVRQHESSSPTKDSTRKNVFSRLGVDHSVNASNSSNDSDDSEEIELEISDVETVPSNPSVFSRLGVPANTSTLKRNNATAFPKFENLEDRFSGKRAKSMHYDNVNDYPKVWTPDESDGCFTRISDPSKNLIHQRQGGNLNNLRSSTSSSTMRSIPPMVTNDWPYHHTAKVSAKNRLG